MLFRGNEGYVLVTKSKKYRLIKFENGKPVGIHSVPSGMWFMGAIGTDFRDENSAVLLVSQRGSGYVWKPTQKAKKGGRFNVETAGTGPGKRGYLNGWTTIEGTAYLLGSGGQIYRWTGSCCESIDPFVNLSREKQRELDVWAGIGFEGTNVFVVSRQLWKCDGTSWSEGVTLPVDEALPEGQQFYSSISLDPQQNTLFLAGPSGVVSIQPSTPPTLLKVSGHDGIFGLAVLAVYQGQVYVTDNYALFKVEGNAFRKIDIPGHTEREGIYMLQAILDGLYVGCKHSLHRYCDDNWHMLPLPNDLS